MKPAIVVTWTEYEAGWGCRPDGASLHKTREDASEYIKEYWARMPTAVPDEYSRPDNEGVLAEVDNKLFAKIAKSKNGIMMWQHEFYLARQSGRIKGM